MGACVGARARSCVCLPHACVCMVPALKPHNSRRDGIHFGVTGAAQVARRHSHLVEIPVPSMLLARKLRRAAPRCCGNRRAFAADMNCAGLRAHAAAAAVWAHCVRRSSCCISVACGMLHVVCHTHRHTQTRRHADTQIHIHIYIHMPTCRRPSRAEVRVL